MKENRLLNSYLEIYGAAFEQTKQKDERAELLSLISDLVDEKKELGIHEEDAIRDVLENLGDPKKLAQKNQDKPDALLSGNYYQAFMKVLPYTLVVTILVYFAYTILRIVLLNMNNTEFESLSPVSMLLSTGAITLIVFIILERTKTPLKINPWTLDDLESQAKSINRFELSLSSAFGILTLVLFMFLPKLLSLVPDIQFDFTDMMAQWESLWPLFLTLIGVGLVEFVLKMLHPKYDLYTLIVTTITNIIYIILILVLINAVMGLPVFSQYLVNKTQTLAVIGLVLTLLMGIDIYEFYKKTR